MIIDELLCKEKIGEVKITSDINNKILQTMLSQMDNPQGLIPSHFYCQWLRGKDSVINKLAVSLIKDYPVECILGYKTQQFYVTSLLGCDVRDYIHNRWNFDIDFSQNKLLSYDTHTYLELINYIVSLTLSKYKIVSLYREHIIYICVKTMFTFFTIYKDNVFLVNLTEGYRAAQTVLQEDISIFENIADYLGLKQQNLPEQKTKLNPTKEDIMSFITKEDSQTDIKNKIMKWYRCRDRKARQIMAQLGLTNQNYTRKDLKKEE